MLNVRGWHYEVVGNVTSNQYVIPSLLVGCKDYMKNLEQL